MLFKYQTKRSYRFGVVGIALLVGFLFLAVFTLSAQDEDDFFLMLPFIETAGGGHGVLQTATATITPQPLDTPSSITETPTTTVAPSVSPSITGPAPTGTISSESSATPTPLPVTETATSTATALPPTATEIATSTLTPTVTPLPPTETPSGPPTETPLPPSPTVTLEPGARELRSYNFGHSLVVYEDGIDPTDETTVPHWVYLLAEEAGQRYTADGQSGFLPQHAELPPEPAWEFETVPGVWDADGGMSFGESDFSAVMLTVANFMQYQPATFPYPGANPTNTSPVQATLDIVDWVTEQEPGVDIYIYENWPDMQLYVSGSFPPTAEEFAEYNAYTVGGFHDWWFDYHRRVSLLRRDVNVVMIPVGPTISRLVTDTELGLNAVPITALYVDEEPHGTPTLYFLAGLITYMGMYGEEAPATFAVPDTVHALVRENYAEIVDFIWFELQTAEPPLFPTPTPTQTPLP